MKNFCKRSFDVAGALVGIALERYFILRYGLALMRETGEDLYFYQDRVGKNGKIFKICKLQTMSQARDVNGHLLPESERLGSLGAKIRRHGIDEFSNFWNVLNGEMSIVGPRPHVPSEVFIAYDPERLTVKPGITSRSKLKVGNESHVLENLVDIVEIRHDRTRGAISTLSHDFSLCLATIKRLKNGHGEEKTHYCPENAPETLRPSEKTPKIAA